MSDPVVLGAKSLASERVAISVSETADLARMGLTPKHYELAIAELARAILVAGGSIYYGGRVSPMGYTQILVDEVQRYAGRLDALTICLPETEHRDLTDMELYVLHQRLGPGISLMCLDVEGNASPAISRPAPARNSESAQALSAMRRYITAQTDARVLVGGRLSGHQGVLPGLLEEALLSAGAGQPLYAAGGFGGAALAVAQALGRDVPSWAPPDLPSGKEDYEREWTMLSRLVADQGSPPADGLDLLGHQQLTVTHRPGDIASLVVLGLSRRGEQRD